MYDVLIISLLAVTLGNLIYMERKVAKLANEFKHLGELLESLQKVMDSYRG